MYSNPESQQQCAKALKPKPILFLPVLELIGDKIPGGK
jgi:hypothetical protein